MPRVSGVILDKLLDPTTKVCTLATDEVPCGELKEERAKLIRKHEAATFLQACWRGRWARKCLTTPMVVTPEAFKVVRGKHRPSFKQYFLNLTVLLPICFQCFNKLLSF